MSQHTVVSAEISAVANELALTPVWQASSHSAAMQEAPVDTGKDQWCSF